MVLRDITVQYKQSILGFAWAIINPVVSMLVFAFIFGKVAKVGPVGVPYKVFSFCGLLPWTYFSSALTTSTNSLITQAGVISKVYFPRLIVPLTPVFSKLADFFIAFIILAILMVIYHVPVSANIVYLPIFIVLMIMSAAGLGMWLSAMAVQYRDIKFAITFVVQLLMYAAPVVWDINKLPKEYWPYYGLYPMAGIIEGFRASIYGTHGMPWDLILPGVAVTVIIFITGAFYFRRMEKVFADVA
jgi:lipopolysaccharide transport system permease protein